MKVAIIGLGQIGSKYDNSLKTSYSHRNSLLRHSKSFEKFYVDKDQLYLASISASDNAVSCVSISQLPNELDLVILSVPTELHLSCFLELIEKVNFKKLILEKPAGANLEESKIINDQASRLDIKVYVNYMRNTLPETQTIRNYIKSNQIKNFKADILVSGDLKNNGSHFLSLLVYLMGLNNMNIKDYEISQDSISFLYGENQIYLRKIPKVSFPFFSMMIFHPNGLIEYSEVQKL